MTDWTGLSRSHSTARSRTRACAKAREVGAFVEEVEREMLEGIRVMGK